MSSRLETLESTDDDDQTASIPHLPDNVIEKILSFLPVNRVAQANTVSKQWAAIWPPFPVIDLDQSYCSEPVLFPDMLRSCLRRCEHQSVLDKLRIRGDLENGFDEVNEWLNFAIQRCVKELDIVDVGRLKDYDSFCISNDDREVLCLESLTRLKLENVRLGASDLTSADYPVYLPSLKTMYLKNVLIQDGFYDANISFLLARCPCIEHLAMLKCFLGDSTFEISSLSLKSLCIMQCDVTRVAVTAKNLHSFMIYYPDIGLRHPIAYPKTLSLWECENLNLVVSESEGLKRLRLHCCHKAMDSSFYTPNLESFEFSGYPKAKVHFVVAPSNLLKATIRIWGDPLPVEYYSAMRDFLESFNCSQKVKIHVQAVECLIIPEDCRMRWSPPLPSIEQLHLFTLAPLVPMLDVEHCRKSLFASLSWMAPSDDTLFYFYKNVVHDDDDDDIDDDVYTDIDPDDDEEDDN